MAMAREEGVTECRNIGHEKSTERSWRSTIITGNYDILREICLGRFPELRQRNGRPCSKQHVLEFLMVNDTNSWN